MPCVTLASDERSLHHSRATLLANVLKVIPNCSQNNRRHMKNWRALGERDREEERVKLHFFDSLRSLSFRQACSHARSRLVLASGERARIVVPSRIRRIYSFDTQRANFAREQIKRDWRVTGAISNESLQMILSSLPFIPPTSFARFSVLPRALQPEGWLGRGEEGRGLAQLSFGRSANRIARYFDAMATCRPNG